MLKKISLFIVGVFLVQATLLAQSDDKVLKTRTARQKAHYARFVKEINRVAKASKFNISGIILDENGLPLNDVELRLEFGKMSPKTWRSETINKKNISTSEFSIVQSGYTSLNIYFNKKGYFQEKRFYGTLRLSKFLKNYIYSKTDEKVVMREIGERLRLKRFDKFLEYDEKNKKKTFCNLVNLSTETLSVDSIIKTKKYIYLDMGRDQSGKIIMIKGRMNRMTPKTFIVKFISNEKDDGFIIKGNKKDISYLTTAPESDYKAKEIKMTYGSKPIYFYYKNGDNYGKGVLSCPSSLHGKSNVWLKLMQSTVQGSSGAARGTFVLSILIVNDLIRKKGLFLS